MTNLQLSVITEINEISVTQKKTMVSRLLIEKRYGNETCFLPLFVKIRTMSEEKRCC